LTFPWRHRSISLDLGVTDTARVTGERQLQENAVLARFRRIRSVLAASSIAAAIALLTAAATLAQTPYPH
jgi:hypothetical protein